MARKNWIGENLDNPRPNVRMGKNWLGQQLARHKSDNRRKGSSGQTVVGNYATLPIYGKNK